MAKPVIQFRCSRCMHDLDAPEEKAGTKTRCPYCFYDLVVPLESTRKQVSESDLYTVGEKSLDTRDLAARNRFASFSCPLCAAILAVDSASQLGTQIVCPDCGAAVTVPQNLQESFSEKQRRAAESQKLNSASGLNDLTVDESADIYGVSGQSVSRAAPDKGTFAVYCNLCNTMMYATDAMIGQKLTCPDCGRETVVVKPIKVESESYQSTNFEGGTHYGTQDSPEISELSQRFPKVRLVPVVCSLCETRMYAPETDIGKWKTCPDCGTKTEIKDVPQEQRILPETSGTEYAVKEPPAAARPTFRVGVDYRNVEGSLDFERRQQLKKKREQEDAKRNPKPSVAVPPRKKGENSQDGPIELIEQKPFAPDSVAGAAPDSYDLEPTAARLIPKPPPPPEMLDSEEPVHVPAGPRPELLYGKEKTEPDDSDRTVVLTNVRLKNRRALSRSETAAQIYHRDRPPRFPFSTRLFRPFLYHNFRELFFMTISIGTLPAAALTYAGPEGFELFEGGIVGAGGESAFRFLMLTAAGVVTGSFWVSFFVTYLLHFFAATSDGDDELGLKAEFSYVEGLFLAGRLVLITVCAALPGYLIWMAAHLFVLDLQGAELTFDNIFRPVSDPILRADGEMGPGRVSVFFVTMCLISHWIFQPLLFLSSSESEEPGFRLSNTSKSVFKFPGIWSSFYVHTLPVHAFLACYVYTYFIYGIFLESLFWSGVLFVSFLLLGSLALTIYFRLLGRLAWVVEDAIRQEPDDEDEDD